MRLFEHLQSYEVVASAVARVNGALEAAKTSENALVKLTLSTAEAYVVPTVQRAVEHVVEHYPLAVDYLDNYSCLALERTETTLANASQRLSDAKRSVTEAPTVAVNRAFELTEQLIDRVLPNTQPEKQAEQADEASASSSPSASSSSSSEESQNPAPRTLERAQAIAQLVSFRLRQRIEDLPKPNNLVDFARARQEQINSAVSALDGFSLRLRESLAQAGSTVTLSLSSAVHSAQSRIEPFAQRLHLDQHLASARHLLTSASEAANSLIEAAKANHHVSKARANFLNRFAQARNGVVNALDAVSDHLPKPLLPAFARFHDFVAYLLTVPEVEHHEEDEHQEDEDQVKSEKLVLESLIPSAPPATFDSDDFSSSADDSDSESE